MDAKELSDILNSVLQGFQDQIRQSKRFNQIGDFEGYLSSRSIALKKITDLESLIDKDLSSLKDQNQFKENINVLIGLAQQYWFEDDEPLDCLVMEIKKLKALLMRQ